MPRPHGVRAQDYGAMQSSRSQRATRSADERRWNGQVEIAGETINVPIAARTKAEAALKLDDAAQRILVAKLFPSGVEAPIACNCGYRPYPHLFSDPEKQRTHNRLPHGVNY